jgi:hypothetical protein
MEYVNRIPADRVAQIHIAGHSKFEKYILDTHDHPDMRSWHRNNSRVQPENRFSIANAGEPCPEHHQTTTYLQL